MSDDPELTHLKERVTALERQRQRLENALIQLYDRHALACEFLDELDVQDDELDVADTDVSSLADIDEESPLAKTLERADATVTGEATRTRDTGEDGIPGHEQPAAPVSEDVEPISEETTPEDDTYRL